MATQQNLKQLKCDNCNRVCAWNDPNVEIIVAQSHCPDRRGCGIHSVKCCYNHNGSKYRHAGKLGPVNNHLLTQEIYKHHDIVDLIKRYNIWKCKIIKPEEKYADDYVDKFSPRKQVNNNNGSDVSGNNNNNGKAKDTGGDPDLQMTPRRALDITDDDRWGGGSDGCNSSDVSRNNNNNGNNSDDSGLDGWKYCLICELWVREHDEWYKEWGECFECWGKGKRLVDDDGDIRCPRNGNVLEDCEHGNRMENKTCAVCDQIKERRDFMRIFGK